ncbi:MAG: hypothetical protein K2H09_03330 [Treponemataceae bacterium]|nr:hypothetical protein [Treponemataceae bacterium]
MKHTDFVRNWLLRLALHLCAAALFALPGFSPLVSDMSGEYVYYRDNTFGRESYIGFLMYDEGTYAARYAAPAVAAKKLPAQSVEILITIDAGLPHFEMTGERIVSPPSADDREIINYLHTLMYEFHARRVKAGAVDESNVVFRKNGNFLRSGLALAEDFAQFGGDVTVIYDYLVPIFNIKAVERKPGRPDFYVVTAGRLASSEDTAFDDFFGFPARYNDNRHVFQKPRGRGTEAVVMPDGQRFELDSRWSQSMENLWLCGDAALLSAGSISGLTLPKSNGTSGPAALDAFPFVEPFLLRQMLLSSGSSYVNWSSLVLSGLENAERSCLISAVFYQPKSGNITQSARVLTPAGSDGYYFLTMTVFYNIYTKNKNYFEAILKSYSIEPPEPHGLQ